MTVLRGDKRARLAQAWVRAVREGENVALRAAVVGGGLGGMAAAVALAQAGIDVLVYEQAQQLTEVGAGVSLAPNGLRMLERLGVGEGIRRVGAPYASAQLLLSDGRPVRHEPHEFVQPGNVGIHRADLLALLAGRLAPGTVRTGHRCTAFSQDDGSATVGFADGTTATADVVIGADGMHSVLQGFVVAPAEPVFSGVVAYRGLVPRLDLYPADALRMWVGEGKHFLVYPVRAGQLLNEELRRDRTARVQLGSRRTGAGYDSSGRQLTDRRWIYEYDAWAEAVALT
jgi:salicylate hydroxylase